MTEATIPPYTKPLPDMRPEGDHWWAAMKEHKLLLPTNASVQAASVRFIQSGSLRADGSKAPIARPEQR